MTTDAFKSAGEAFRSLIEPIVGAFKLSFMGPLLALGISFIAFFVFVMLLYFWHRANRRIKSAQRIISLADGGNEPERCASFVEKYEVINAKMSGPKAPIPEAWREFSETLIIPDLNDPDEKAVAVDNSVRPHHFFTPEAVGASFSFLRAVPNILVGVGLVLTFIGLVAALQVATQSLQEPSKNIVQQAPAMNSNGNRDTAKTQRLSQSSQKRSESAEMKQILADLLTTAAAKFYASLTALFWSIILTIFVKWAVISTRSQLHIFNNLLEERLSFANAESIAQEQLKVMLEQKNQLEIFNSDMAARIGDSIKQAMEQTNSGLMQELQSIAGTFKQLVATSGEATSEAVNKAIDTELTTVLRDTTQTLQTVTGSMNGLPQQLESVVAKLQSSSTDAAREAEERMRSVGSQVHATLNEGAQAAAQTLASSASGISSTLTDLGERSDALAASLQSSARVHQELVEKIGAGSQSLQESIVALRSAAAPITDSVRRVTESSETLQEVLKGAAASISEAQESIREQITENQRLWREHVGRFDQVDEHLGTIFGNMNQQLELQASMLRERVTDIDKYLGTAVNSLGEHVETLVDVKENDPSVKALNSLAKNIEELVTARSTPWQRVAPAE